MDECFSKSTCPHSFNTFVDEWASTDESPEKSIMDLSKLQKNLLDDVGFILMTLRAAGMTILFCLS